MVFLEEYEGHFRQSEITVLKRNVDVLLDYYNVRFPSMIPFSNRMFEVIETYKSFDYLVKPEETGLNVLVRDKYAEEAPVFPDKLFKI